MNNELNRVLVIQKFLPLLANAYLVKKTRYSAQYEMWMIQTETT